MNRIFRPILCALTMLALSAVAAQAACYVTMPQTGSMSCSGGRQGNSADFTTNCNYTPLPDAQVEVPCPGMWVNTVSDTETQQEACARLSLQPGDLNGQVCASGERRPTTGTGSGGIRYRYGTWGSPGSGGLYDELRSFQQRSGGGGRESGNPGTITTYTRHYCWGGGQKRDYDGTDILIAYYCGG